MCSLLKSEKPKDASKAERCSRYVDPSHRVKERDIFLHLLSVGLFLPFSFCNTPFSPSSSLSVFLPVAAGATVLVLLVVLSKKGPRCSGGGGLRIFSSQAKPPFRQHRYTRSECEKITNRPHLLLSVKYTTCRVVESYEERRDF